MSFNPVSGSAHAPGSTRAASIGTDPPRADPDQQQPGLARRVANAGTACTGRPVRSGMPHAPPRTRRTHLSSRAALALVACVQLAPAVRASDLPTLNAVADAMERAVLARDKAAYLAHVATADPVLRAEQVHWAADFDRHAVEAFTMDVADVGDAPPHHVPHIDARRANLTVRWRMSSWAPGSERTITFPALFVREGDAWTFAGEAWPALSDEHNTVLAPPELRPVAERVLALLPRVRAHVDEGFEAASDDRQVVKLYDAMPHLQASIYLSYTDPLGGWNEPGEAIKLLARPDMDDAQLLPVLAHEYAHVATFRFGPHASDMPWWALEGVAELASEQFRAGYWPMIDRQVRAWAAAGGLAAWDALADFHTFDKRYYGHVYTQGEHMVAYITERFGRAARNRWLRALAAGQALDAATLDALGVPWAEVDSAWRAGLAPAPAEPAAATPADATRSP